MPVTLHRNEARELPDKKEKERPLTPLVSIALSTVSHPVFHREGASVMFAISRGSRPARKFPFCRPTLEVLEDRSLPALAAPVPLPLPEEPTPFANTTLASVAVLLNSSSAAPLGLEAPGLGIVPLDVLPQTVPFQEVLGYRGPNVPPGRLPMISATAAGPFTDSLSPFSVGGFAEPVDANVPNIQVNPAVGAQLDPPPLVDATIPPTPWRLPAPVPPAEAPLPPRILTLPPPLSSPDPSTEEK